MNKSYKSIWNETLGTYVAAAEISSTGGRKSSSTRKTRRQPDRAYSGQMALEQRIVFDAAMPTILVVDHVDSSPAHDPVLADLDKLSAIDAVVVPPAVVIPAGEPTSQTKEESQALVVSGDIAGPTTGATESAASPVSSDPIASVIDSGVVVADSSALPVDAGAVATTSEANNTETPADVMPTISEDIFVEMPTILEEAAPIEYPRDFVEMPTILEEAALIEEPRERVEIIFVDAVVADVANEMSTHPGEVYVLDAGRDGVEQIAEILNGRTGIDAVHIISHGSAGELTLGYASLNADTMAGEYADEMAVIRAALSEEADLLLYGCDVAATEAGVTFLDALAQATGADVAASNDDTGEAALGGDWVLEATNSDGSIETVSITATQRAGLLTTAANTGAGAILVGTNLGEIYSVDVVTGKATLITVAPPAFRTGTGLQGGINSLAVDQVNGLVYYADNNAVAGNVSLYAYDFLTPGLTDAQRHIVIDSNVTDNGITVGTRGMGSGGAVFANGSLYLGVESVVGTADRLYRVNFSGDGRTITGVSTLVATVTSNGANNDWGDLGYNPATNTIQSVSGTVLTRYNATTGAVVATVTGFTAGLTQQGYGFNGEAYGVGTAVQQYNAVTGALIGTSSVITTNGTAAVAPVND
ncbi:MAG: DUF4347 domain-containing protein, partial [Hydrogenophaga sp.]